MEWHSDERMTFQQKKMSANPTNGDIVSVCLNCNWFLSRSIDANYVRHNHPLLCFTLVFILSSKWSSPQQFISSDSDLFDLSLLFRCKIWMKRKIVFIDSSPYYEHSDWTNVKCFFPKIMTFILSNITMKKEKKHWLERFHLCKNAKWSLCTRISNIPSLNDSKNRWWK